MRLISALALCTILHYRPSYHFVTVLVASLLLQLFHCPLPHYNYKIYPKCERQTPAADNSDQSSHIDQLPNDHPQIITVTIFFSAGHL